ncbi:MAG TPA: co-chaperone GroES [Nitrospirales bacterium]|nr:co-chaperone GroES [Nitrospirales bacterium]HIA14737.1 co-chaperone GroES [Nitrospirales bacterium]HIB53808.1 co-chaperone GroES [Nitrospirales bacterium]HIC04900.1 co-chaperone GroES [Nitrospirales bacterium]HIN32871.1 co-chaperone GroES [Nitrospirales bacterium]
MGLRPLHDWIIVKPDSELDQSAGGIFIPESAQEKPKQGTILAIGKGRDQEEKDEKDRKLKYGEKPAKTFVKTILKPGQVIIYDQWAGQKVELDGEDLVMVKEDEVLGTVE